MKSAYKKHSEKNEIRNVAAERLEKIAAMIKELEQKNRGYQEKFLKNELTWPEVGTMGHIVEMLEELTGKRG